MANADSFFCIGFSHKVCQDYAAHGFRETGPYAIISDGCSSAPETDFGSRLLVKAKERLFSGDSQALLIAAYTQARSIGLPKECLAATLLTVRHEAGNFIASVNGDGVVVGRKRTGELMVYSYEYPSNAPYYLYYTMSPIDAELYAKQFGKKLIEHKFEIRKGEIIDHGETDLSEQWDKTLEVTFSDDEYEFAAVVSDGIHSFLKKEVTETSSQHTPVKLPEIVQELFAFKNLSGEFVQRRCLKGLKDLAARGITHYDDLSVGAVAIHWEASKVPA